jgi:hypothetical protein
MNNNVDDESRQDGFVISINDSAGCIKDIHYILIDIQVVVLMFT